MSLLRTVAISLAMFAFTALHLWMIEIYDADLKNAYAVNKQLFNGCKMSLTKLDKNVINQYHFDTTGILPETKRSKNERK